MKLVSLKQLVNYCRSVSLAVKRKLLKREKLYKVLASVGFSFCSIVLSLPLLFLIIISFKFIISSFRTLVEVIKLFSSFYKMSVTFVASLLIVLHTWFWLYLSLNYK